MSYVSAQRSRLLVGDFSYSPKLNQVSGPWEQEMLETTTLADTAKAFIAGVDTSSWALSGFLDLEAFTDATVWARDLQPITYAPSGLALGAETMLVNALKTKFEPGSQVAGVVSFDLEAQTDGLTDIGLSLHDLTAETADGSAAAVDGGAATTNGGVAQIHVTDYSGLTSAAVIVEDSANGTTGWATIASFASVTALTSERVVVAGNVRRYTRCTIDVTGTGSVTYQVSLARR